VLKRDAIFSAITEKKGETRIDKQRASPPPQVLSGGNILRRKSGAIKVQAFNKCMSDASSIPSSGSVTSELHQNSIVPSAEFIQTFNQAIRLSKSPLKIPSIGINKSKSLVLSLFASSGSFHRRLSRRHPKLLSTNLYSLGKGDGLSSPFLAVPSRFMDANDFIY
jgi:hypothetical protein